MKPLKWRLHVARSTREISEEKVFGEDQVLDACGRSSRRWRGGHDGAELLHEPNSDPSLEPLRISARTVNQKPTPGFETPGEMEANICHYNCGLLLSD